MRAGDVIELVGDLGAGKTQLTRGIVRGLGSIDDVQSPSFMVEKIYEGGRVPVHHYDFHRLQNPGIVADYLQEALEDKAVVIIEWADSVADVLPGDRKIIKLVATSPEQRVITANFELQP